MLGRLRGSKNTSKKDLEELNLKEFYRNHVTLRLLDKTHLMKEIEHHMNAKIEKMILTKEQFQLYKEKAQENMDLFDEKQTTKLSTLDDMMLMISLEEPLSESDLRRATSFSLSELLEPERHTQDILFFEESDNNEE
jgi:hypothetical protein